MHSTLWNIAPPPVIDGTKWVRFRDTYLNAGLCACAAGPQLRLATRERT
jgi:hypothetical protein